MPGTKIKTENKAKARAVTKSDEQATQRMSAKSVAAIQTAVPQVPKGTKKSSILDRL